VAASRCVCEFVLVICTPVGILSAEALERCKGRTPTWIIDSGWNCRVWCVFQIMFVPLIESRGKGSGVVGHWACELLSFEGPEIISGGTLESVSRRDWSNKCREDLESGVAGVSEYQCDLCLVGQPDRSVFGRIKESKASKLLWVQQSKQLIRFSPLAHLSNSFAFYHICTWRQRGLCCCEEFFHKRKRGDEMFQRRVMDAYWYLSHHSSCLGIRC
jgi:hypothetical protein